MYKEANKRLHGIKGAQRVKKAAKPLFEVMGFASRPSAS